MHKKILVVVLMLAFLSVAVLQAAPAPKSPKKQTPWGLYVDSKEAYQMKQEQCQVPCDHTPKKSYPLFRTRQILNDWLSQNQEEA